MRSLKYLIIPVALRILLTCGNLLGDSKEFVINNNAYQVSGNDIVQTKSSFLEDGFIKIGVVSDIEGAIDNAKNSAKKLREQNPDLIIVAGDCYENEKIRRNPIYPNSTNNLQEMIKGIEPYAQLNIPVFVIAGNHERKKVYNKALKELKEKYQNIFDINEGTVDLKGFNIVGMGGYHHLGFTAKDGFLLNNSDYNDAYNDLKQFQTQYEPTIFVTHGPPKSKTLIDYVEGVGNVGDETIRKIMNSNLEGIINVHGHIHEGGGNLDRYNSGVAINVAAITDFNNLRGANTGLITINQNGEIKYQELR